MKYYDVGKLSRYSNRLGMDGRCWILSRSSDFSLLRNLQTGSEADPASHPIGTGGFSWWKSSQGVNLTIHLRLVPRSRMMELYTATPRQVLTAWCLNNYLRTGTTSPLPIIKLK
jgi:hypothetical protein